MLDLWLQNFQHIGDFKHVEVSIAMKHPDADDVVRQKAVKFVGMVIVKTAYANTLPHDALRCSSLVGLGHAYDFIHKHQQFIAAAFQNLPLTRPGKSTEGLRRDAMSIWAERDSTLKYIEFMCERKCLVFKRITTGSNLERLPFSN